jgi:predicted acylesterase/phospholipase RssA
LPPLGREMLPEGAISTRTTQGNDLIRTDLAQALSQRLQHRPMEQAVTMLALSGGGANGAFGAGVMEGWTQRGDRPEFDVVTGISTGALMAPLIFLGHRYDETLTNLYTNLQVSRIYLNRPLAQVFKELSLKDPGPLRALIRELITEEFVEELGREHHKGRRLFVGTTDLDLQRSVIWDIGAIALGRSADKVPKIRDILLASSSVPLIFPPVYFTVVYEGRTYQQMHVDGGIESPLLVPGLLSDLDSALTANQIDRNKTKVRLFALANQQIEVENNQPVEPGMVAIAVATINHSQRSNLGSNLSRLQLLSKAQGVDMRVLAIPSGIRLERDSLEFDGAEMKLLYQLGLQLGGSSDNWK